MKKIARLLVLVVSILGLYACGSQTRKEKADTEKTEGLTVPERPSDAELMTFKVYHHMRYMVTTAEQAGGLSSSLYSGAGKDP